MTIDEVLRLVRPNILALQPYSTARDEYEGGDIDVWLDANENPFENGVNRYPDPHHRTLKAQLSAIKNVDPASIFIGNGSDEAIDLVYRVFARPGIDNVVSIAPTYGMYSVAAATNDIELREVALDEDFQLRVDEMLAATDKNTKALWLCSPNNPTGNCLRNSDIERLLAEFRGIVVIDEAYIDFADGEGYLPQLSKYKNLIVLQTLSKAWGMAGLRFGLAFAAAEVITLMNRVKYPYNINVLTQARAAEGLAAGIDGQLSEILAERKRVVAALSTFSTVTKVYPSDANFVLIKVADADKMYDALVGKGVIVRNRSKVQGCASTLRLTIGTKAENDRMLEVIEKF